MAVDPPRILRMTRRFEASPERVFDAWLDPPMVRKWLFASPAHESYVAKLDTRVSGKWTITARRAGTDYTGLGEYLEIDRPRRLAFTFAMPQFSPNSDRITVEIAPDGKGCLMTFTQEGVDIAGELQKLPPGQKGGTEQGWEEMFDALGTQLGQPPQVRSAEGHAKSFSATTRIRATPETIWKILTDASDYANWNPEVTKVEGRFAPDEKIAIHKNTVPKVATVKITVFEPARRLVLVGSGGMPEMMLKAERTYTLAPRDGGVVEVMQHLAFSGLMAPLITKSIPDQQPILQEVGEALKKRAELV